MTNVAKVTASEASEIILNFSPLMPICSAFGRWRNVHALLSKKFHNIDSSTATGDAIYGCVPDASRAENAARFTTTPVAPTMQNLMKVRALHKRIHQAL